MAMLSSLDVTSIKTFWQKLSGKGLFIAVLDFFFLSLAVYTGYTIRLGVVMPRYIGDWLSACLVLPAVCVTFFTIFGQYKTIWQHAGTEDFTRFVWSYIVSILFFLLLNNVVEIAVFPRATFAVSFLTGLFLCGGLRFSWRMVKSIHPAQNESLRTLIIGAGEAGAILARDLMHNEGELSPAGFVDDDPQKSGHQVSGLKVFGNTSELREIVEREKIQVVLIAIPSVSGHKKRQIYDVLAPMGVQVRILPSMREIAGGKVSISEIRQVKLEDLLGREPVRIDLEASMNYVRGKRVLITGAGGSIGSEIVRQVIHNEPSVVFALGHGEQSIYLLMESLSGTSVKVQPIIADVADEVSMLNFFDRERPQVIFHAAAHKHVPLMELSPREAMRVNDLGTRTIARCAGKFGAERMVMISTDKAVNPSSVMGATKRLAEKILEREQKTYPETKYMAVRFGNVLGSRGSVIPKFERQISSGGPVTVTHPDMKRYFMLIPEAVSLVIQAGALGHGGELFVLDMGEPVVIREMAELLIRLCGYEPYKDINIVYSGIRPGEKLYEELFYDENSVNGTLHPKIFVSKIKQGDPSRKSEIDTSLEYALRYPDEALGILKKLVPEFVQL
ncbi:MAG: polysaccharide biosynthesis protein [Synergistaceae bacterium]|nr:polysaccharide biosynthesis protein [Synergistaceae bacterium]